MQNNASSDGHSNVRGSSSELRCKGKRCWCCSTGHRRKFRRLRRPSFWWLFCQTQGERKRRGEWEWPAPSCVWVLGLRASKETGEANESDKTKNNECIESRRCGAQRLTMQKGEIVDAKRQVPQDKKELGREDEIVIEYVACHLVSWMTRVVNKRKENSIEKKGKQRSCMCVVQKPKKKTKKMFGRESRALGWRRSTTEQD